MDTARISGVTINGYARREITVCERLQGNNTGAEPTPLGSGPDAMNCLYSGANVTYRN